MPSWWPPRGLGDCVKKYGADTGADLHENPVTATRP
jgi:hypothetical protein